MAKFTSRGEYDDMVVRWLCSGYQTASGAKSDVVTIDNTSDIWATGTVNFQTILESGIAEPELTNMEITISSYTPYCHAEYYSGGDFIVDFPTWEVFCSGYIPSGTYYTITQMTTGGKSIDEIRDEVYRIVGSQYVLDREIVRQTWTYTRKGPFYY